MLQKYTLAAFEEDLKMREELARRGVAMSSAMVETDENGEPYQAQ